MKTQLLIVANIVWLPLCRINKFGLNTLPSKTIAIPYTCGLSPPNAKFISYNNLKKSVASSSAARMHPWVDGALTVTGKLRKEVMDLRQQINKLEEKNHILRGIIAKNIAPPPPKKKT